jgi:hypothetical protein
MIYIRRGKKGGTRLEVQSLVLLLLLFLPLKYLLLAPFLHIPITLSKFGFF